MIATLSGVSYSYPGGGGPALEDVTLGFEAGAMSLLAGPSAGGKSTLLRTLNGLVPQFYGGTLGGSISAGGLDPARTPARRMARVAGMVFQEPEAQGIGATVAEDIAFGMEQMGIAPPEMRRRMAGLLERFGIAGLADRPLAALSGGERQRAAIAAAMALEPAILLCDEPTSQLDPAGANAVASAIEGLASEGTAVLIAEHRLERFLPRVKTVVIVEGGRARSWAPRCAAARLEGVPAFIELALRGGGPAPLTREEARQRVAGRPLKPAPRRDAPVPGRLLVQVSGLRVSYGGVEALSGVDLEVREGEAVALVGPNGSGKTTLLRAIAGLGNVDIGTISFEGRPAPRSIQERSRFAGLVPQDPAIALYQESVRDEVATGLRYRKLKSPTVDEALRDWRLEEIAERNPRDVSVGQQLRVAIGAMLAHRPKVWLMDEPTRGADAASRAWLAAAVRAHIAAGGAAIVATHDVETAATFATRAAGLEGGRVAFQLPARAAFGHGGPCETGIAALVPWAVTLEDIAP